MTLVGTGSLDVPPGPHGFLSMPITVPGTREELRKRSSSAGRNGRMSTLGGNEFITSGRLKQKLAGKSSETLPTAWTGKYWQIYSSFGDKPASIL